MDRESLTNPNKRRCKAMVDAGIEFPDSYEGKQFCVNSCPYKYCVVFENSKESRKDKIDKKAEIVKRFVDDGYSIGEIAELLNIGIKTVKRRIKAYERLD